MFSQENCTTDNMKESEDVLKSSRNSEQKCAITETWQGHPRIRETHRQSSQCLDEKFFVKQTSDSLYYKKETACNTNSNSIIDQLHLPKEAESSNNAYREESVKSVLQEDPGLHNGSGGIQRCQQIRGKNSGHLKNYTGSYPKREGNETLLKNEKELLLSPKMDGPNHKHEMESDNKTCKDKLSDTQANCLAEEASKLQLAEHEILDPFDRTLTQQLLTRLGFPRPEDNNCYVNLNVQVPQFKNGGTVTLGKFLP
jgi:hypothetical protein